MNHLRRFLLRFARLFTNTRAEADLAREVAAHLTLLEDDYLRQGMAPAEARLAAKRAYGNVEQAKQLHRNERSYQGLAEILRDIRHTLRQLRKSPAFTATAVLMLALGIGSTTAIFSIVEGVLLRPLPFPNPDRLVILGDILEASNCGFCTRSTVTAAGIRNYMRDTQSFTHLGGYQGAGFELSGTGDPVPVNATRMSGEVFAALGVDPLLGRVVHPAGRRPAPASRCAQLRHVAHSVPGRCENCRNQDPSRPQTLYRDRRDAAQFRVSPGAGAFRSQRALGPTPS